jgi:hypothetical protein
MRAYDSVEEFYRDADPRLRERSPEIDFGVHWTDPLLPGQLPPGYPGWRVSWCEHSGEVYAACHVSVAGLGRPVRVYGVVHGRDELERAMDGWVDHCGTGGLWWLEQRFAEVPS